jgi:hypothetical protein
MTSYIDEKPDNWPPNEPFYKTLYIVTSADGQVSRDVLWEEGDTYTVLEMVEHPTDEHGAGSTERASWSFTNLGDAQRYALALPGGGALEQVFSGDSELRVVPRGTVS